MKFKLYIALASRVEDEGILNLFRFPVNETLVPGARWWAKWWSGGTRQMQSKDRESIFTRVAHNGFNEVNFTCKTGPAKPARTPQIAAASLYAKLSPHNILWAPVPEQTMKSIQEDRRRKNFARLSRGPLPGRYQTSPPVREKPCITEMDCTLAVETNAQIVDHRDLQLISVELIRKAIPQRLRDCAVFGYGCIGGECRNMGMAVSVGSRGGNVDDLGEKFENIYPILIGPTASCNGLADALGNVATLPLFAGSDSPASILSIPSERTVPSFPRKPEVLAPSAANPNVRRWLV